MWANDGLWSKIKSSFSNEEEATGILTEPVKSCV
jgi:hypothetical protein